LHFKESKLKPYKTPEEYDEALSYGSDNGGVAAIFDEIPYVKLFLAKYGPKYAVVGPIYQTDGFGFVSLSLSLSLSIYIYIYIYDDRSSKCRSSMRWSQTQQLWLIAPRMWILHYLFLNQACQWLL
jgi:hypothetical protein